MSNLLALMAAVGGAGNIIYQVADDTVTSLAPEGQTSDMIYFFTTAGLIRETIDLAVGGTQTNAATITPWSDDGAEDGVGKYIRCSNVVTGIDRRTDAIGTAFVQLNTQRNFTFQVPDTEGPYNEISTYTIDLSLDGTTVHDTMLLTVILDNQGP